MGWKEYGVYAEQRDERQSGRVAEWYCRVNYPLLGFVKWKQTHSLCPDPQTVLVQNNTSNTLKKFLGYFFFNFTFKFAKYSCRLIYLCVIFYVQINVLHTCEYTICKCIFDQKIINLFLIYRVYVYKGLSSRLFLKIAILFSFQLFKLIHLLKNILYCCIS